MKKKVIEHHGVLREEDADKYYFMEKPNGDFRVTGAWTIQLGKAWDFKERDEAVAFYKKMTALMVSGKVKGGSYGA